MKRKKGILTAALAAAVLLAGCAAPADSAAAQSAGSQSVSSGAALSEAQSETAGILAEFSAQTLDGETIDQSVLSGKKLTMINVWATYCGPCLREMPDLGTLATEYANGDVQIIGIPIDTLNRDGSINADQQTYAQEITQKTGADSYLHLLPSESLINAKLASVSAVPTTFFVDESGNEVGKAILGSRSAEKWRQVITERLEALEG